MVDQQRAAEKVLAAPPLSPTSTQVQEQPAVQRAAQTLRAPAAPEGMVGVPLLGPHGPGHGEGVLDTAERNRSARWGARQQGEPLGDGRGARNTELERAAAPPHGHVPLRQGQGRAAGAELPPHASSPQPAGVCSPTTGPAARSPLCALCSRATLSIQTGDCFVSFGISLRLQTHYFSFRKITQLPLISNGAVRSAESFPEIALRSQLLLHSHYRFVFQDRRAEEPEPSVSLQKDGSDED